MPQSVDKLFKERELLTNIAQQVASKVTSGSNLFPDLRVNAEVGYSTLNTVIYDYVRFSLSDLISTIPYSHCVISISSTSNVSKTYIYGRPGSIKQITGSEDYDITFNIKLVTPLIGSAFKEEPNTEKQQVGKGINLLEVANDYVPNSDLNKLIEFLQTFYKDPTYKNIQVESIYLNEVFGIYNIVPYSFSTQQDVESSNTYNITINAYSDLIDDEKAVYEILPK